MRIDYEETSRAGGARDTQFLEGKGNRAAVVSAAVVIWTFCTGKIFFLIFIIFWMNNERQKEIIRLAPWDWTRNWTIG